MLLDSANITSGLRKNRFEFLIDLVCSLRSESTESDRYVLSRVVLKMLFIILTRPYTLDPNPSSNILYTIVQKLTSYNDFLARIFDCCEAGKMFSFQ